MNLVDILNNLYYNICIIYKNWRIHNNMCFIFNKVAKQERKDRKIVLKFDDETLDQKVKIQGTEYDRKRKCTQKQILNMQNDIAHGMTVKEVATKYNVSEWIVRYNTDSAFRAHQIEIRSGKHTGVTTMDFQDRVAYKRELIKSKKLNVTGIV